MLLIQNFDYKITCKKSSDVIIADALSQAPVQDDKFQFHFRDMNLLEFLAVSEQTRDCSVSTTKEDKCWCSIIKLGSCESVLICIKSRELQIEVRLYGLWDIPLFASG